MIICICGPTAVGKTKLSIQLAKKYNAIIINADAMQVYKGLDIGTAKITEKEKENVKHFLFDIKSVEENYTVYDYQKDVRNLLDKYRNQNIILVGGTGLYMKSALYDYRFADEKDSQNFSEYSNQELYDMCLKKDKNMNIHINNRKRMIRFLNKKEVSFNKDHLLYDNVYFIGLTTNRELLYQKINKRVDQMFEEGLINEVKRFYDLNIRSKALLTAIGYKELYQYFDKKISLEEAKELIKKKSRNYAKRQYTWFNNQMSVVWFNVDFNDFSNTENEVIAYLEKSNS